MFCTHNIDTPQPLDMYVEGYPRPMFKTEGPQENWR